MLFARARAQPFSPSRLTAATRRAPTFVMAKRSSSESASQKPMYSHESQLPSLPVPTLEETAERYLRSAAPFHTPQAPGSPNKPDPSSFKAVEDAVKDFRESPLVKQLQERLLKRANDEGRDSWLSDWWNEAAYFGYRGPVVPGVNYFYVHKDDKSRRTGPKRAAGLIRSLLFFRRMCISEILEPEMARKTPLAMSSYQWLFNSSRIPTPGVDSAEKYDMNTHNHIVVLRNNKFYEVPVVDKSGDFLSEKELEIMFARVVEMAGDKPDAVPVGALTSADRDLWTKAREEIIAHDANNKTVLERIQSAIIVLALDQSKPVTREEIGNALWVGDGRNRFFDKHQIIVFDNGRSGFNGEHSCMDGTPTSRLNDWMLRSLAAGKVDLGSGTPRDASSLPSVSTLELSLPESAKSAVKDAAAQFDATMAKHEIAALQWDGYGKDTIKRFKLSPDSFAQLVMAYAHYRMCGEIAATYESAQTRKYKLGRTEVIRTATSAALAFCKAMDDPAKSNADRLELLRAAGAAHVKLAGEAADGRGVDRHFFGLKKLLKEGEPMPAIFTEPTFARSAHWKLSTSNLSSEFFDGWGYGEVVDDGYGLAYSVNSRSLRFNITSMNGPPYSVAHFKQHLEDACREVGEVAEGGLAEQGDSQAKAKL